MDYGLWNNDLRPVAALVLGSPEREELARTMPQCLDPWRNHAEETELDALRYLYLQGAPLSSQIPLEFGALLHCNTSTGMFHLRFHKGCGHGMARSEDHAADYEHHKYNQRLNPRPERVGNYNFGMLGNFQVQRKIMDMQAGSLAHFPNIGGMVTVAPFKASGVPFAKAEATQSSTFVTKLLSNSVLRQLLIEQLFTNLEALSHLTRTCQTVRRIVEQEFGYFPTNRLQFLHCDKSPDEVEKLVISGKLSREDAEKIHVPKFLFVGRVRYQTRIADGFAGNPNQFWPPRIWKDKSDGKHHHSQLFNVHGFRNTVGYTRKREEMPFSRHCVALQKLLKVCHFHPRNLNYVMINSLDSLSVPSVTVIIEGCPNLKGLCIYSCPLINLAEVRDVIRVVGEINRARIRDKQPKLDLDIAPRFRQGPVDGRRGSYGITHSDPKLFANWNTDVGCALGASLVSLLREADKAGIQLCQPGKAFRLWLDKLPLKLNQAVNLCIAAANFLENEKKRWEYAYKVYPSAEDLEPRAALVEKFNDTVAVDLLVAALARPINLKSDYHDQDKFTCIKCQETLPGKFFRPDSRVRRPSAVRCEGCELASQLQYERGNNQWEKNTITNNLWLDAPEHTLSWIMGESPEAVRNHRFMIEEANKVLTVEQLLVQAEALDDERQEIVDQMNELCDWKGEKHNLNKKKVAIEADIELLRVRAGFQRQPKAALATEYDWDYRRRAYHWIGRLESGAVQNPGPVQNVTVLSLQKHFTMLH